MSGPDLTGKLERPALPRDAFRSQRAAASGPRSIELKPVVVTPSYEDGVTSGTELSRASPPASRPTEVPAKRTPRTKPERNPFEAYGERSSSRPYALRLPDPIDLVLRQLAAEERTHPLRVIDRILLDHLKRIGRLPPP